MDISSDFLNIFQISWIFLLIILIALFYILYNTYDHQSLLKFSGSAEESKVYKKAALSSTSQLCEEFVINVFRKGGSVADAAIVSLLVQGLTSPQSLGVGGGFLMVYYDRKSKQVHVLNAREYSPSKVTKNMYKKTPSPSWGGLSSAIPGEVYGYWELHQRFGKLPWKSLFDPVIKLCREGIPVTRITSEMLVKMRTHIMTSSSIKEIFCNPKTGDVYKPGEFMKRPALAKTFETLATEGVKALYDGSLTKEFVQDIMNNGGIITEEDMKNYRAKWMSPISMSMMNNKQIYTTPNPGCGQIFLAILDVIFSLRKSDSPSVNWFRIVETWKHAFGYKSNMDGPNLSDEVKGENYDPSMAKTILKNIESETSTSSDVRDYSEDFEKMGHEEGTCHINLLSPNGDAVSVTSSINYAIGALYCSESTGIIMNNHMMDFSIPEYMDKFYSANQLGPSKQPVSSMVPTIIVDSKTHNVAMVVGAAGGFKILTAASQILIEMLVFDIPQELAIAHRRLHHQLVPMILFYEEDFPKTILDELKKYGHHLERIQPGTGVAVITVNKRGIRATGDPRRLGSASGY